MEDSNNSKVHGGSISDEKLAALYDFLTDEGFCPECIENESIIFSYYGTSVEICCPNEDNRDIYSLVYIADANKDILMNDWDWMIQVSNTQIRQVTSPFQAPVPAGP